MMKWGQSERKDETNPVLLTYMGGRGWFGKEYGRNLRKEQLWTVQGGTEERRWAFFCNSFALCFLALVTFFFDMLQVSRRLRKRGSSWCFFLKLCLFFVCFVSFGLFHLFGCLFCLRV